MTAVFLSYSHVDSEIADQIGAMLDEIGIEYFRYIKNIELGDPITAKVREGLNACRLILVVVSPASLKSHWVPYEIGHATALGKKIVSYVIHPSLDVPQYLSELSYATNIDQLREFFASRFQEGRLPRPISPSARQHSRERLGELLSEMTDLSPLRRNFWEILDASYVQFRDTHRGYPQKIGHLAEEADPPAGLPLPPRGDLFQYPSTLGPTLCDDARRLYEFCNVVYPAYRDGATINECSYLPNDVYDAFDEARREHAFFWRKIGHSIYDSQTLDFYDITTEFAAQRSLTNLLSYLEISLTQWTRTRAPGKSLLFKLNRDWNCLVKADQPN